VEYGYDGLERMVSRTDNTGATVLFFHDGLNEQIALETDAGGAVTTRYLVDAFGVARGKLDIGNSTGRSYYITDPRANVTQMIGASDQAVKAVFAYDPYGKDKTALSKKLTANWDSRLKFQMAPRDPKTGSYNIGARLMNPTINRFVGADNYVAAGANLGLQVDPLTGNRYLYAGCNPIGLIDDGHKPLKRKECREVFNKISELINGTDKNKGLLERMEGRAKFRDFGTKKAKGHITAMEELQVGVIREIGKWVDGRCGDRNWPGGTAETLEFASELSMSPDPGTGAPIPTAKGVRDNLGRWSWVGGLVERMKTESEEQNSPIPTTP